MRLICPKCEAQYEIDDGVIPPEGRDVQCSNCSTTWFQTSAPVVSGRPAAELSAPEANEPEAKGSAQTNPAAAPAEAEEAPAEAGDDKPAVAEPIDEVAAELADAEPEPEPAPETTPEPEAAAPSEPDAVPTPAVEPMAPQAAMAAHEADGEQRRIMDDSVVSILREEADRESKARKSDASALEHEAELGLAVMAAIAADSRQDNMQDEDAGKGGRRNVLPDIDQINSTLRATSARTAEPAATAPDTLPKRRVGFRRGFVTILAMAMVLLGIYTAAPRLAERFPAAEPALSVYVAQVDRGRLWLDEHMKMANLWMQGNASQ